jgi:hypothetical protein
MSLDPTKKYQLWITYAAISDPDEDWSFLFSVGTFYGPAFREQVVNVPKGSPFVYRQESTIFRGWNEDLIYVMARATSASKTRLVAIDDIYVA